MMEITAIPPTTPPAIAPVFDLWPTLEGPRIAPGASSGLSIKIGGVRTRSETREGKDKGEGAHHRRNMIRWGSTCSHSDVCAVIKVYNTKGIATYCDIDKRPTRNTYPRRNRVWKPASQFQCESQQVFCFLKSQGTHDPAGRAVVQLVLHCDQLLTDT